MAQYDTLVQLYDSIDDIKKRIANEEYEKYTTSDEYIIGMINDKIKSLKLQLDDYTQEYQIQLSNFMSQSTISETTYIHIKDLGELLYTRDQVEEFKTKNVALHKLIPHGCSNVYYYPYMTEFYEFEYCGFVGTATEFSDIETIEKSDPGMKECGAHMYIYTNGILLAFGGCS